MATAALSTLTPGSFFTAGLGPPTQPEQKYLLTKSTGSIGTKMVAYNITQAAIQELDQATVVTELFLLVGISPLFTV